MKPLLSEVIFQSLRVFRTSYDRISKPFQKHVGALREIGSDSAARCEREITREYDEEITIQRQKARANFFQRTKGIQDQELRKKIRYFGNFLIAKTDQCPRFKKSEEFYSWCGIDRQVIDNHDFFHNKR